MSNIECLLTNAPDGLYFSFNYTTFHPMKTPTQIYLPCHHSCDITHEYQCPEGQLHALEVQWYYPNSRKKIVDETPVKGAEYIIRLQPSLTLDTAAPFWAIYLPPLAFWNGIQTEADIQGIRFCLCGLTKTVVLEERTALVKIELLQVVDFEARAAYRNPDLQWWSLLHTSQYKQYGNTANFENYSYLKVSMQGDLGITAIVKKEQGTFEIVAINEWDFHLNDWSLCSMPLNEADCELYGLQ